MRELTYVIATSIDGFIAGPDGQIDAFPAEGDHVAALLTDWTDALPTHVHGLAGVTADNSRFDTLIMGWKTYEPALAAGIDSPYSHLRQYVASRRTDRQVPDGMTLTADPLATVRDLKAEGGATGIVLAGGAELASALVDEIDRVLLKVYPLILGAGVGVFAGTAAYLPRQFDLVDSRTFETGVTFLEFARRA